MFLHEISQQDDPVAYDAVVSRLPTELHEGRIFEPVCLWAITNAALHMIMRRIFCRVLGLSFDSQRTRHSLIGSTRAMSSPPPPPPRLDVAPDDSQTHAVSGERQFKDGWTVAHLMKQPVRSLRDLSQEMTREINSMLVDFQHNYQRRCLQLEKKFADRAAFEAPRSSSSLYMELPAVDLCYDALFERLRPDTIVMLFNVLICQRNVVVTAPTVDGLTDVMEVALSLLW